MTLTQKDILNRGISTLNDVETQLNEEAQRSEGWDWDWNLTNLIKIGFGENEALEILSDYHSCIEVRKKTDEGRWFAERLTYLYLHHQVILKFQFSTAPNKAIQLASTYMAISQNGYDEDMRGIGFDVGLDMMRYHVWKGPVHRDAYIKSLNRFDKFKGKNKKSAKARNKIIEEIDDMSRGEQDDR
jgi:hypothetical protein